MLVLGIDTCTAHSSVSLGTQKGIVASAALGGGRAHGEFVAPAIDFCLRQAGVGIAAVNGVAVTVGPGLFTGMRVGIATAQTIAHARRLPVVGLPSLDLLAFRLRAVRRPICAVLDAKRNELFWGRYRSVPGGVQRLGEFKVGTADALAAEIQAAGEDVVCVGDGALLHAGVLDDAGADVVVSPSLAAPDAACLVELALPRFLREETQRPEELTPVYLRSADARIGWQQRGALFGGRAPDAEGSVAEESA